MSWKNFEDRVRGTASHIWGRQCNPKRVGGVNLDGYLKISDEWEIFIEITEEKNLSKVRSDITKLHTARIAAFAEGTSPRCYCVLNGSVTQAMADAGKASKVNVLSIDDFSKMFFDFEQYQVARSNTPFGSAINPITGASDDTDYVAVKYIIEGRRDEVNSDAIAEWIRQGKNVILLGEYGTGKSRCVKEVFRHLSDNAAGNFCYPFAIDLRNSWGLSRNLELIRRHMLDLGLDTVEAAAVRAFNSGSLAVLLDGFDEIGSQSWSNDAQKLKQIRSKSLEGVKDIVRSNKGGILITGREHYFPSSDEMFMALGTDKENTIVARCKNEFSDTELLKYFRNRDIDLDVPEWLPRRPLICQTITDLADDQFSQMFGAEGEEIAFWNHFITILCERDARINVAFDASTIMSIFIYLARITRTKQSNVGPISLSELQEAFEAATGAMPVEEASVMLQRLPSLGRVSISSNDRQFVDVYILDGLRAKDIVRTFLGPASDLESVATAPWINPLDDLGQRVLAQDVRLSDQSKVDLAHQCRRSGNLVMACDLVGSLTREDPERCDFRGLEINNGVFNVLNLRERSISNLYLNSCYIGEMILPSKEATNVEINHCVTPRAIGITSARGLPYWIKSLEAETFDSVASTSRIRKIGLKPAHEIFATIIRKTFFQRGSGRKEEALMRGLGSPATRNLSSKIIALLVREGLLSSHRGDEGTVYTPERSQTKRMQEILDQLQGSVDPIWLKVGDL